MTHPQTAQQLPERLEIDGINARLIIGTPDKATCSTCQFAAELVRRYNAHSELVRALNQFAGCDLNDTNCASLEVATCRVRGIARQALAALEAGK